MISTCLECNDRHSLSQDWAETMTDLTAFVVVTGYHGDLFISCERCPWVSDRAVYNALYELTRIAETHECKESK